MVAELKAPAGIPSCADQIMTMALKRLGPRAKGSGSQRGGLEATKPYPQKTIALSQPQLGFARRGLLRTTGSKEFCVFETPARSAFSAWSLWAGLVSLRNCRNSKLTLSNIPKSQQRQGDVNEQGHTNNGHQQSEKCNANAMHRAKRQALHPPNSGSHDRSTGTSSVNDH